MPTDRLVVADAFDRAAFARALAGSRELRALVESGEKLVPCFRALVEDLHAALFRFALETRAADETPPSAQFHRRVLLDLIGRDEFRGLREATVLDEPRAALALARVVGQVQRALASGELLDERELIALRELEWAERELADRRRALDDAADLGDPVARGRAALEREATSLASELRRLEATVGHALDSMPASFPTSLASAAASTTSALDEAEAAA